MDFSWWDARTPERFMEQDREHPIREVIPAELGTVFDGHFSMAEVGPASGWDYERHWRHLVLAGQLDYTMCEGSRTFAAHLTEKFPEVAVAHGGFDDLGKNAFDIVYTKDTMKYQTGFEEPLSQMLAASRRFVAVVWNTPPGEESVTRINKDFRVHDNLYRRTDILELVESSGYMLRTEAEREDARPRRKAVWILEQV